MNVTQSLPFWGVFEIVHRAEATCSMKRVNIHADKGDIFQLIVKSLAWRFPTGLKLHDHEFRLKSPSIHRWQRDPNKWTEGIRGPGQTQTTNKWQNRNFFIYFR